jgi:hypothetical protein
LWFEGIQANKVAPDSNTRLSRRKVRRMIQVLLHESMGTMNQTAVQYQSGMLSDIALSYPKLRAQAREEYRRKLCKHPMMLMREIFLVNNEYFPLLFYKKSEKEIQKN